MTGREPETGPTHDTVAANVRRCREGLRLQYLEVSERVSAIPGARLTPVAVRNIEQGKRRVTVDELMALSVALETTPIGLLKPITHSTDELVTATGVGEIENARFWYWLQALYPLARPARVGYFDHLLDHLRPKFGMEKMRIDTDDRKVTMTIELGGLVDWPNIGND